MVANYSIRQFNKTRGRRWVHTEYLIQEAYTQREVTISFQSQHQQMVLKKLNELLKEKENETN